MEITVGIGLLVATGWGWLAYRCVRRGRRRTVLTALGAGVAVFLAGIVVSQATWSGTGGLEDLGSAIFRAFVVLTASLGTSFVILARGAFSRPRSSPRHPAVR